RTGRTLLKPGLDEGGVIICGPYEEEFVKAFSERRTLEPFQSGENGGLGDARFAGAGLVAFEGFGNIRLEEITDDAKTRRFGRFDVAGAIGDGRIGVVDHKALLRFQTE